MLRKLVASVRPVTVTLLALGSIFVAAAWSEDEAPPTFEDGMSGRDIYAKVLENQLATSAMEQRTLSEDQSGDYQEAHFWSRYRDYRVDGKPDAKGVISKSMMKYTLPHSYRDSGYLFVEKYHAVNEGFNYSRGRGKVMRVRTSEETVFGTDFTLEDLVAVRILDDATYERRPDEEFDGVPVYVVMMQYLPESRPQYARSLLFIDQEFFLPLKSVNWGHDGVQRNEMTSPRERIEQHGGKWIPMEVVMKDLRDRTTSWLYTDKIDANPELAERLFEPQRLGRNRR